jgi:DNA processing protein
MQKSFFHARNRWIAGVSAVTVIVEANRKSGSSLTAKMALEEGRTIATLPVSPVGASGLGNLDLLASGAQLIRDCDDLMALMGAELESTFFAAQGIESENKEENIHAPKC